MFLFNTRASQVFYKTYLSVFTPQIATVAKLCFLLQVDDVHEFSVWYHMIADVVKYLVSLYV